MGLMGRYIDTLPSRAKDRMIRAQNWCIADVVDPRRARCLVGHAEDWESFETPSGWWHRSLQQPGQAGADFVFSPEFFAFRRARPADPWVYRERIERWGLASESRIGERFDKLCARRGLNEAVRLVKARAARGFAPEASAAGSGEANARLRGARQRTPHPASAR
jgi:hypothetical protein